MKRKPETVHRDVQRAINNLIRFNLDALTELARIDRFEVWDTAGGGSGPKAKNTVSDPTAAAVLRRIGKQEADPVGKAIKEIERALYDIANTTDRLVQMLAFATDPKRRQPKDLAPVYCAACQREVAATRADRLRSGYCSACYTRWVREGKPYRGQFELNVREAE